MSSNNTISFPKLERALGMRARILARSSQDLRTRSLIVQEGARNNNGRKASDYIHSVEQKVNEISRSTHDNAKVIQDSVLRSNTTLQRWIHKTKLRPDSTSSTIRTVDINHYHGNDRGTRQETRVEPSISSINAATRYTTNSCKRGNTAQNSRSSSHHPPSSYAEEKVESSGNHDDDDGTLRSPEWRDLAAATRVWRQSKLRINFEKMRVNAQRRILWKKKWSRKLRYWGNLVHLTFRCPVHGKPEEQQANFTYGEEDALEHYKWRLLKIGFVRWCIWVGWRGKRVYPPPPDKIDSLE